MDTRGGHYSEVPQYRGIPRSKYTYDAGLLNVNCGEVGLDTAELHIQTHSAKQNDDNFSEPHMVSQCGSVRVYVWISEGPLE